MTGKTTENIQKHVAQTTTSKVMKSGRNFKMKILHTSTCGINAVLNTII